MPSTHRLITRDQACLTGYQGEKRGGMAYMCVLCTYLHYLCIECFLHCSALNLSFGATYR